MNLLHIDSGILGENSVSRQLTASLVARLKVENPAIAVVYRDLAASPIGHLSGLHLAASSDAAGTQDEALRRDVAAGRAALDEFLAADILVLGAPMYNFSVPSQLKAWIDRIAIAGKTFRYTENGPEGLVPGKTVIIASTRGGVYDPASPPTNDYQEPYLTTMFSFFGITDIRFVRAEGLSLGPEARQTSIATAESEIDAGSFALQAA